MAIEAAGEDLVPVAKKDGTIGRRHLVHKGRRQ